jgi:hypothetical protein
MVRLYHYSKATFNLNNKTFQLGEPLAQRTWKVGQHMQMQSGHFWRLLVLKTRKECLSSNKD